MLAGISLIFHSFLNTVAYPRFLEQLDALFANATFFDNALVYYIAPLVPFIEFGLGLFLALGLHTKAVLKMGIFLLLAFSLFLWDVSYYNAIMFHAILVVTFFVLHRCLYFNKNSIDFQIKTHSLL